MIRGGWGSSTSVLDHLLHPSDTVKTLIQKPRGRVPQFPLCFVVVGRSPWVSGVAPSSPGPILDYACLWLRFCRLKSPCSYMAVVLWFESWPLARVRGRCGCRWQRTCLEEGAYRGRGTMRTLIGRRIKDLNSNGLGSNDGGGLTNGNAIESPLKRYWLGRTAVQPRSG